MFFRGIDENTIEKTKGSLRRNRQSSSPEQAIEACPGDDQFDTKPRSAHPIWTNSCHTDGVRRVNQRNGLNSTLRFLARFSFESFGYAARLFP